ncbi:protein POLLEN DEFECTIVE IN GUIDANCE 1-like [Tasmannia lanceolata]|uniref:protein POLLEN DEFECTIVE IN GUIDANCE 1-like n=1 Tax=Tasmannia lanceolata TaxID=3420 RepID=UPI0040636D9D
MALRSGGRNLSFDLLSGHSSDEDEILSNLSIYNPIQENDLSALENKQNRRRRRKKRSKNKTIDLSESIEEHPVILQSVISEFDGEDSIRHENGYCTNGLDSDLHNSSIETSIFKPLVSENGGSVTAVLEHVEPDFGNSIASFLPSIELRQRNVDVSVSDESMKEEIGTSLPSSLGQEKPGSNGTLTKLETAPSLDWKRIMAENSNSLLSMEKLPLKYFMEEIYAGNSLRSTTSVGNEKKRQRVYNTMFHVPWRCELLIDVGFFVCLDSFLSLLAIMPTRIVMTTWRFLTNKQFQRPCATELSDFGCLVILACGITILEATDISLIYHFIRGQGTIKLYVVYNVLEIFDKLCQSFGGDVLQVLFNSAEGVASCSSENMAFELMRFILDQTIAVVAFIVHSFVLLAQAITLSTCIVAHNNALLALLVSNNFGEIKSNVFKRLSKENLHNLVYHDTIERFHITAFVLFVLAQNILEAEGPWFGSFLTNALMVFLCEMFIDVIKHSFLAKFNEIKPVVYSEFLEHLCKQTLNIESEDGRSNLTFVPLAPACVVIRVLTPVYAAHLPIGPLPWRLSWIFFLSALTYIMLVTLKIMVGMGLKVLATWYVNRCLKRKQHLHLD